MFGWLHAGKLLIMYEDLGQVHSIKWKRSIFFSQNEVNPDKLPVFHRVKICRLKNIKRTCKLPTGR